MHVHSVNLSSTIPTYIYYPSVFNLYSGCQKSNLMSFENHEYIVNRTKRQYLVSNKDFIEKLMVKVYTSIYKDS